MSMPCMIAPSAGMGRRDGDPSDRRRNRQHRRGPPRSAQSLEVGDDVGALPGIGEPERHRSVLAIEQAARVGEPCIERALVPDEVRAAQTLVAGEKRRCAGAPAVDAGERRPPLWNSGVVAWQTAHWFSKTTLPLSMLPAASAMPADTATQATVSTITPEAAREAMPAGQRWSRKRYFFMVCR